jgi:hypothetical protein
MILAPDPEMPVLPQKMVDLGRDRAIYPEHRELFSFPRVFLHPKQHCIRSYMSRNARHSQLNASNKDAAFCHFAILNQV